jgi:hypothetical protein
MSILPSAEGCGASSLGSQETRAARPSTENKELKLKSFIIFNDDD